MTLFHLERLISKEDFADAHEPVNDGVKEVPNAQTIAAEVGKGDVGKDTTTAGEDKIIPEKEDTDDATEKQFDTVSESAEKGSSDAKPAPKTDDSSEDATADSGDTGSETKTDSGSESDTESEGTTPNSVKVDDEPLEHETLEAAEDEQKKTEKVTDSLERFIPHAERFDLIGYPKAERDRLQKSLNWISRRTGGDGKVTISAESISNLAEAGRGRVAHLAKQIELHARRKVSSENFDPVTEQAVTEAPTEHGNPPLSPEEAAGLTEREIDPLDVDVTGLTQVQDAIQTLHGAQVAIEQHMQILKSNKFISQQAAAVLQAGLEHIDQICGLKVRATGLEGYDTTPRSAMAKANISVEALNSRAADLGAKVLKWIAELLERAKVMWARYKTGVNSVKEEAVKVAEAVRKLKGDPATDFIRVKTNANMYLDGKFTGNFLTTDVLRCNEFLRMQYKYLRTDLVNPMMSVLKTGGDDILEQLRQVVADNDRDERQMSLELPGGHVLSKKGTLISFEHGSGDKAGDTQEVPLDIQEMRHHMDYCVKFLDTLASDTVIEVIKEAQQATSKGLIQFRKGAGKDLEETDRQKIQSFVIEQVGKSFDLNNYFDIVKYLSQQAMACIKVNGALVKAWGDSSEE